MGGAKKSFTAVLGRIHRPAKRRISGRMCKSLDRPSQLDDSDHDINGMRMSLEWVQVMPRPVDCGSAVDEGIEARREPKSRVKKTQNIRV